jgi:predicted nucleic acid-binding protein
MAVVADSDEVLGFIERHKLHGKGIGYVDVHLLASVALTDGARLWTRDKRLSAAADELGYACSRV